MNTPAAPVRPPAAPRRDGEPARPSDARAEDFAAAVQRAARRGPKTPDEPAGRMAPHQDPGAPAVGALLAALPPPTFASATAAAAPASRGDVAAAEVGAALTGLLAPADADGLQHWQFSFAQAGLPLSAVALTLPAVPGGAMQLQLRLPAHSRERSALAAGLDSLRERLATRGAAGAEITLHDDESPGR